MGERSVHVNFRMPQTEGFPGVQDFSASGNSPGLMGKVSHPREKSRKISNSNILLFKNIKHLKQI